MGHPICTAIHSQSSMALVVVVATLPNMYIERCPRTARRSDGSRQAEWTRIRRRKGPRERKREKRKSRRRERRKRGRRDRRERRRLRRRRRKRRRERRKRTRDREIRERGSRCQKVSGANRVNPEIDGGKRRRRRWALEEMASRLIYQLAVRAQRRSSLSHPVPIGGEFGGEARPKLGEDSLGLTGKTRDGLQNHRRLSKNDWVGGTLSRANFFSWQQGVYLPCTWTTWLSNCAHPA